MTASLFPSKSDALLSACGQYRYWLSRVWDDSLPRVAWLMLNPSTATADTDDPTIRKVMSFSRKWGFGGIVVVNLFAWRATDPRELSRVEHPVSEPEIEPKCGEDPFGRWHNINDGWIRQKTDGLRLIAAWGTKGALRNRDVEVMQLLGDRLVECLGVTADGHPFHPLYLPGNLVPEPFKLRSSACVQASERGMM